VTAIPPEYHDLVGAPHFGHLATINADGSPQSSPIWIARDGDTVLFVTDGTYKKARNIARDPRVALSIQDESNLYRYLELRGRATMTPRDDYSFVDQLSNQYTGQDYPDKRDDAQGRKVRIEVDKAVTSDFAPPPSQPLPNDVSDLRNPPHFGHVATINPNGYPQTSPVWIKRDGDDILFWTSADTRKAKNLAKNPAVAVSIRDVSNPYRYIELRGVAELESVGADYTLLDELARAYWQVDEYPEKSDDANAVVVRIKPNHQASMG
jgi:PPOX class probable F420-dependent enzyme